MIRVNTSVMSDIPEMKLSLEMIMWSYSQTQHLSSINHKSSFKSRARLDRRLERRFAASGFKPD